MYLLKILTFQTLVFFNLSKPDSNNPSHQTGPRYLQVTHYDLEENEQKTLHKYAINQVTHCQSEPHSTEKTNVIATFRKESTLFSSFKRKQKQIRS